MIADGKDDGFLSQNQKVSLALPGIWATFQIHALISAATPASSCLYFKTLFILPLCLGREDEYWTNA